MCYVVYGNVHHRTYLSIDVDHPTDADYYY